MPPGKSQISFLRTVSQKQLHVWLAIRPKISPSSRGQKSQLSKCVTVPTKRHPNLSNG